jgi:hypothetical protein
MKHTVSINVRANNNYLNYPTFASMRDYGSDSTVKLIKKSDVVVFHTAIRPFFQALGLKPEDLEDKQKLLYFHGSDCRNFSEDICSQADEYLKTYKVLVSTPDLKTYVPAAYWMPVCRDFTNLRRQFLLCNQDQHALQSFGARNRLVFAHAPTNPEIKGSQIFYRSITYVVQALPDVEYRPIKSLPWDSCMRAMSQCDVYFDQCILGAYGMAAVEASVFKKPVVCLLSGQVIDAMEKESGLPQPYIQFKDEDALREQCFMMVNPSTGAKIRKTFGDMAYKYARKMHDVKPCAERFLSIVNINR